MTATALGALAPGSVLGRYELLLPIAQGGMATVWAARMKGSRGFAKIVAIKTMLPSLSEDPRFEKMFLSEAELASRIKHPNVCEILDLGEEEKILYLVMEWIDGESLTTLLADCRRNERTIPYAVAARIGLEVARGLHAAHELKDERGELVGVVHRDVSPHNILMTADGIIKVVDFGVAKAVLRSDYAQTTSAGHLKGKVHFMAPEQAFCDEVDRRTDVFALGIVLYYITTGEHPFRADNDLATLARITSPEPVKDPCELDPSYPPELSAVIKRALSKEPEQRFASMHEMARHLEPVVLKLSAEGEADEAFVAGLLRARADARAEALREARRAADELAEQRTLAGVTARTRGSAPSGTDLRASQGDVRGSLASLTTSGAPAARGLRIAAAAGLVALGAALGAAALLWARPDEPPTAPSASAAATPAITPPRALPSATAEPVTAAGSASAMAPSAVPSATATASAPPSATMIPAVATSPKATAAKKPPVPPTPTAKPTSGKDTSKFRDPGF